MATYQGSRPLFLRARNATINGGSFTTVDGDMTIHPTELERPGLTKLFANIAPGAFHDAAERGDPPKCHPRTRVAIRDELMQWIKDPQERQQFITWLYGPAGAGKTAIAQSIAEACAKEHLLAASFFFGRLASGRNTLDHFIPTIAYQLSRTIPEIQSTLLMAIENDPAIFSRSLSTQMQVLIINPLTSVRLASTSRVVVVDGIDECGPNDQAHAKLLKVLGTAIDELRIQNVSILFLIGSRPEYEIRTAFNKNPFSSFTKSQVLDDKYQPDEDIKTYLESKFREIHQKHLPSVAKPWPSQSDIKYLVKKASGQFIFAATVIKFIDNPRRDPKEQLKIILGLSCAGNETPFALLDALYLFILFSVADVGKVLEILTVILLGNDGSHVLDVQETEELLSFNIRRALLDMHALVFVPPFTELKSPLHIHHASLYDFLMDRSRSLEFYIDPNRAHASLCIRWLTVLGTHPQSRKLRNNVAITCFNHHYSKTTARDEVMDALAHIDLRASLEGISDLYPDLLDTPWHEFLLDHEEEGNTESVAFSRLKHHLDAFICNRISRYPPSLRTHIPYILREMASPYDGAGEDIRDILFHGVSKSPEEFSALCAIDKKLLGLRGSNLHNAGAKHYFYETCYKKAKEAREFLDAGRVEERNEMLKIILGTIYSKPGERNHQYEFTRKRSEDNSQHLDNNSLMTMRIALLDPSLSAITEVIWRANLLDLDQEVDPIFANFLLERVVQFRNDVEPMPGRREVAWESIEYIRKSGIPFLEHAHQPDTNECAICTECADAIVMEDSPMQSSLSI